MANEGATPITPQEGERIVPVPIPQTLQEKRDFLKRLNAFRKRLAAEHGGPFENSVKVLAMTRERNNGR